MVEWHKCGVCWAARLETLQNQTQTKKRFQPSCKKVNIKLMVNIHDFAHNFEQHVIIVKQMKIVGWPNTFRGFIKIQSHKQLSVWFKSRLKYWLSTDPLVAACLLDHQDETSLLQIQWMILILLFLQNEDNIAMNLSGQCKCPQSNC